MPNMNATYRNALATAGAALITHIGLVDNTNTELAGGDPAYARKPVGWDASVDGYIQIDGNLLFDIPAGANVSGWRGYNQLDPGAGSVEYGGKSLTQEVFAGQGTYALLADETGIEHN